MKDETAIPSPAGEQSTRRKRRRKKTYSDATYGARLPHEDARIADDYARQHKLDRAGVVRLAMKQFAYRQQMRYQPKSDLEEMREQVFREHFAPIAEQLDALALTLHELPQTLLEFRSRQPFASGNGVAGNGETDAPGSELAHRLETEISSQRRALEQALFASVLTLRLVTNYLIEPQLRRLDGSDGTALEPHLRAASNGKEAWGAGLAAVMKLTGERVMSELGFAPSPKTSGAGDAAQDWAGNGEHTPTASVLSDADVAGVL
jgi:hypothetical protein